jgi:hypothetical protein
MAGTLEVVIRPIASLDREEDSQRESESAAFYQSCYNYNERFRATDSAIVPRSVRCIYSTIGKTLRSHKSWGELCACDSLSRSRSNAMEGSNVHQSLGTHFKPETPLTMRFFDGASSRARFLPTNSDEPSDLFL